MVDGRSEHGTTNANGFHMAAQYHGMNGQGSSSTTAANERRSDDRRGQLNASYVFPASLPGQSGQEGVPVVKEGNMLRLEALVAVATREERVEGAF